MEQETKCYYHIFSRSFLIFKLCSELRYHLVEKHTTDTLRTKELLNFALSLSPKGAKSSFEVASENYRLRFL